MIKKPLSPLVHLGKSPRWIEHHTQIRFLKFYDLNEISSFGCSMLQGF